MENKEISFEYIRGLIEAEGYFTFASVNRSNRKEAIPAFQMRMGAENKKLLEAIKAKLNLKNKIYSYKYEPYKDKINRGQFAMIIVREIGTLKNIIVPLCYAKLVGNKNRQFAEWLDKIGKDPLVPERYKIIHELHRLGYFRKNQKFLD